LLHWQILIQQFNKKIPSDLNFIWKRRCVSRILVNSGGRCLWAEKRGGRGVVYHFSAWPLWWLGGSSSMFVVCFGISQQQQAVTAPVPSPSVQ